MVLDHVLFDFFQLLRLVIPFPPAEESRPGLLWRRCHVFGLDFFYFQTVTVKDFLVPESTNLMLRHVQVLQLVFDRLLFRYIISIKFFKALIHFLSILKNIFINHGIQILSVLPYNTFTRFLQGLFTFCWCCLLFNVSHTRSGVGKYFKWWIFDSV